MTDVPDFVAGARALLANDVQGRCPACGCTSLFLGEGGYVTCPRIDCPEPDAASTLLEGRAAQPDETARCPKSEPHAPHMWTWREEGVDCPGLPSANATTRHVGTSTVAAPATADDGLREQYAAALTAAAYQCDGDCGLNEHECFNSHPITWSGMVAGHTHITGGATDIAEICLAVRDRRMKQLTTRAEGVERSVQLLTTDLLNVAQQRDQAEATIARVRSLTGRWAKRTDQLKRAAELLDDALDGPGADRA